jgi:hypothetical protein
LFATPRVVAQLLGGRREGAHDFCGSWAIHFR